jgi:hypothetical protein
VYAAPNGSTTSSCTLDEPCAVARAIAVASSTDVRNTIRLEAGRYGVAMGLEGKINIVGDGAIVEGDVTGDVVTVAAASEIAIRGVDFQLLRGHLTCAPTGAAASFSLQDSSIGGTREVAIQNCAMAWDRVTRTMSGGTGLNVGDDGGFSASRSTFEGTTIGAAGRRMSFTLVNSLLDHANIELLPMDQAPHLSTFKIAFVTAFSPGATQIVNCSNFFGGNNVTLVENNVLSGAEDAIETGPGCMANHNVLFPQTSPVPLTNKKVDPRMVAPMSGNYTLAPDSPAIDAAMPSAGLDPTIDFDGVPRPQGAGFDIGAFERRP